MMAPVVRGRRLHLDVSVFWLAFWRIGFGLIWLVDAWFKWQYAFINGFVSYLSGNIGPEQPVWVVSWIHFWIDIVRVDPRVFAYLVASGETALAAALLLGLGVRLSAVFGSALSFIIWSTGEAFGGPYTTGATDVGAAIIYIGGFGLLALAQAGYAYGLDGALGLSGWSWRRAKGPGSKPPTDPATPD